MVCLPVCVWQAKAMVYEQEVYNQFTYKKDQPYFHSFPADVSISLSCPLDCCLQTFLSLSSSAVMDISEHMTGCS